MSIRWTVQREEGLQVVTGEVVRERKDLTCGDGDGGAPLAADCFMGEGVNNVSVKVLRSLNVLKGAIRNFPEEVDFAGHALHMHYPSE